MTDGKYYTTLSSRGLIHLEGPERHDFLQGLITNDMNMFAPGKALYTCLLTPQGKFLHDFFVSVGDDFTLLECEGGARAQDLFGRLNKYRLRSDVQISVEENVPVYVIFGDQNAPGYPDPRHPEMGFRSFEKPKDIEEKPFDEWDCHRIRLGIPDGSRDMIPDKSTLDEANIKKWNGVSYEKGCYVGQELTARMKHRGLGKKHLYPIMSSRLSPMSSRLSPMSSRLSPTSSRRRPGSSRLKEKDPSSRKRGPRRDDENYKLPAPGAEIHINGKSVGEMRSSCGDVGMALLKDDYLDLLKNSPFVLL